MGVPGFQQDAECLLYLPARHVNSNVLRLFVRGESPMSLYRRAVDCRDDPMYLTCGEVT
jgi:hypothetical protein